MSHKGITSGLLLIMMLELLQTLSLRRSWLIVVLLLQSGLDVMAQEPLLESSMAVQVTEEQRLQSAEIVERARQSLVCVASVSRKPKVRTQEPAEVQAAWREPLEATDPNFIAARYATGFVISDRGHILVPYSALGNPKSHSYFVWSQGAVAHGTLRPVQAEVVVGEPYTNLAVLHILDDQFWKHLEPIDIDSLRQPQLGEPCLRVACDRGYAITGALTAEWGSVTNMQRSIVDPRLGDQDRDSPVERATIYSHAGTFQTNHLDYIDFAGAAFFNRDGQIIGMGVDRLESNLMYLNGSFALPTDQVFQRVVRSLQKEELPEFGFLGIQPAFVEPAQQNRRLRGTFVAGVIEGMPGDQAGLKVGDVITQIGDHSLESRDAIFRVLAAYTPGDSIALVVRRPRGGDILYVDTTVKLSKRYVATPRPAFVKESDQRWQGALIDYATAFPPELLFQYYSRYSHFDPKSIAVMDTQPGTASWSAGMRVGQKILSVNGIKVDSPRQFHQLVNQSDRVKLAMEDLQGRMFSVELTRQ